MSKLTKIVPIVLACMLAAFIFFTVGGTPPKISEKDLHAIQAKNPKFAEVSRPEDSTLVQFEVYDKPIKHQYRIQALTTGTATLFDNDGKKILSIFLEAGDTVVTIPKDKTVDAIGFQPFEWFE